VQNKKFHQSAFLYLFLFYAVLHACVFTLDNYATDDYMQSVYAQGSDKLEAAGLLKGIKTGDINFFVNNQFNFFDPQTGNDVAMRNYGALPWWTKEQAMLHLWRPVSSLTHWLDYQLWPDSKRWMQAHNGFWMFASFLLVALMFKRLLPSRPVFIIALLVYALDISVAPVVGWIAARNSFLVISFLALTLFFFHHSFTCIKVYALAILCFILALLSAEAGIVVIAYLAAYVLFYPTSTLKQKIIRFLPFFLIMILWRWFYHAEGFGAFNIGQYIDPVRSPIIFMEQALRQFPILFIEMATGIDAVEVLTPAPYLYALSIGGWIFFCIFLFVVFRYAKQQGQLLFWFFAAIFSLMPGLLTYSSDPRVVIYAHIGFSVVVALLLVDVWKQYRLLPSWPGRLRLFCIAPLFFLHIVVQFIAMALMNYAVLATNVLKPEVQYAQLYGFEKLIKPGDNVVIINHRDVFRLMYYPYIALLEEFPLPQTLRQINTAQTSMTVRKLSDNNYVIAPEGGFIFHPDDMQSLSPAQQQQAMLAGRTIKYATFFHDGDYRFSAGDKMALPEMELVISKVDGNSRPMLVEMHLHPGKNYRILYWDWPDRSYKILPEMTVGETFFIAGPQ
jgi:hypothetical protein